MTLDPGLQSAYRHCETVTRSEARNFSYGIRLLPPVKRRALSAVYAFARRVDDIGDGVLPADQKLARLATARSELAHVDPDHRDPVLAALGDAARRLPIPLEAFEELIEGVEADVRGTSYATFDELLHYCRCVAGSVGRLSLGVFGTARPADMTQASSKADALGVALQLTNILRDVREDLASGRLYLPAEDLDRFGCHLDPRLPAGLEAHDGRLERLVVFEVARAQRWYDEGLRLVPLLDRRSAACCGAMAGIYHRLLCRIAVDPGAALRTRTSLSGWEKAAVALRSLAVAA